MIKYLVFDIDDTLLARKEDKLEESTINAINLAREKGLVIIVSTGRGYSFMQQCIIDDVKADYFVTINGSCINGKDGKPVKEYPVDPDTAQKLFEIGYRNNYPFGIKYGESFQIYNRYDDFTDVYCDKAVPKSKLTDHTQLRNYHLTHKPLSFFFYQTTDRDPQMDQLPLRWYGAAAANSCEAVNRDVNKGRSLKELIESLGGTMDEVMSFGDGDNDIAMMEISGISVAMGNGKESVKAIADYVTDPILHDGIYNALKKYQII